MASLHPVSVFLQNKVVNASDCHECRTLVLLFTSTTECVLEFAESSKTSSGLH
ncbi:MAG: hypothetical protein ACI8RD_011641 [Bacillariaceae sp.]|jgi:hypothetical protein